MDGVFCLRHNSFEHPTSMCMQCVQMKPINIVPNKPTYKPEFLNACGIASTPVPIFPFSRWINVSAFDVGCSNFRCKNGSYSLDMWTFVHPLCCTLTFPNNGFRSNSICFRFSSFHEWNSFNILKIYSMQQVACLPFRMILKTRCLHTQWWWMILFQNVLSIDKDTLSREISFCVLGFYRWGSKEYKFGRFCISEKNVEHIISKREYFWRKSKYLCLWI